MSQKPQELRKIYDLLEQLCRKFSSDNHKDILKRVTSTIADSHQGFLAGLQFEEVIIVSKIKNHLAVKNEKNLATFLNLHNELSTLASPTFRSSILTLLLYLSDMESKLPNTSRHEFSSDSVFPLPVRSRGSDSSGNLQEVYRTFSSRVSSKCSSGGSQLTLPNSPEPVDFLPRQQLETRQLPAPLALLNLLRQPPVARPRKLLSSRTTRRRSSLRHLRQIRQVHQERHHWRVQGRHEGAESQRPGSRHTPAVLADRKTPQQDPEVLRSQQRVLPVRSLRSRSDFAGGNGAGAVLRHDRAHAGQRESEIHWKPSRTHCHLPLFSFTRHETTPRTLQ
jgi:hypothetical protein